MIINTDIIKRRRDIEKRCGIDDIRLYSFSTGKRSLEIFGSIESDQLLESFELRCNIYDEEGDLIKTCSNASYGWGTNRIKPETFFSGFPFEFSIWGLPVEDISTIVIFPSDLEPRGYKFEHVIKKENLKQKYKNQDCICVKNLEENEKIPKDRIIQYPQEEKLLGITSLKSTIRAFFPVEFDSTYYISIAGEYEGDATENLILMVLIYNAEGALIGGNMGINIYESSCEEEPVDFFSDDKILIPYEEYISEIHIRLISDPNGWIW